MKNRITILWAIAILLIAATTWAQSPEIKDKSNEEQKPAEPVLTPPKLIDYVTADYPPVAFENGVEGQVLAQLDIDENGLVTAVEIKKPAGHGFDEAAETAMHQFVFEPATRDGEPIVSRVLYNYTFFFQKETPVSEEKPPLAAALSGVITDMDGSPIPDASVALTAVQSPIDEKSPETIEHEEKAAADLPIPEPVTTTEQGSFRFQELAAGTYQVDVVAPGFTVFSQMETLVEGEERELIYRLETERVLYETIVRARRPPREVTRREITRREITKIPGTGGDALRSVQNLPGMARAPGFSGQLIIRGSSPSDSRYFFDQMPVPILYHFGGLTSIINSDLLESIDYYPGNFGVRYGNATGGIIEVRPRAPASDRVHAYIDADLWDISAMLETPLTKDWSIAVSGRRSYIDAIINNVFPDDGGFSLTVAPRYWDYQVIVDYHPGSKDNLRIFAFGSDDKMVFVMGNDVASNPNFSGGGEFGLFFHQLQIRWDHNFSNKISNSLNVGSGYIHSDSAFGGTFKFYSHTVPIYLRDEFIFDPKRFIVFRTGLDNELHWNKWKIRAPDILNLEGEPSDPLTANQEIIETTGNEWSIRAGWYAELELLPVENLRLIYGVRIDYYNSIQKVGIDPRFVARYEVIDGTILKGGFGLFHQRPQPRETDSEFGNPDLELINAIHYSVGVEQRIIQNLEIGVELFYKDLSNLVVNSNDMVERDGQPPVPERYNNDGQGQVYGLEFMLKHYPTDRLFGWVSYTLMRSTRVDHPGWDKRLFDYDQTHILTVVASVILGRGWEAGIRYRLVTGNPDTPIISSIYDADSDIYLPIHGKPNSKRLPTFHQLDFRIDKKWQWKYLAASVYIDIQNVYNQKNPEGYSYNFDYTERQYFYGLPIIPSFGMKLEY